jgi:DNA-binding GntR family transcriptional regulator
MVLIPSLTKNAPLSREDFAYEAIKEAILSGELLPNQKISLTDLARSLGVSIIPVNNAVKRLTSEGLINQDPHHSPFVAGFSSKAVGEVLTIRYHLEELALREAVPFINGKENETLRCLLDQMDIARRDNDMHLFGRLNRQLHMQIYSYGPYPMLCEMIVDLWNKSELNRSRLVFSVVPDMAGHSHADHAELLDLIQAKDIEGALKVLHRHKNYSRLKLLESLEKLELDEHRLTD